MPKHLSVATRKWEGGGVSETTHDKQCKIKMQYKGNKECKQRNKIRKREISMDNLENCNLEIRRLAITLHGVKERDKVESKAVIAMNKQMLNLDWNAKAHRVMAYSGTIRRHRRKRCADEVEYANKCER
jgi:hypothetical protein